MVVKCLLLHLYWGLRLADLGLQCLYAYTTVPLMALPMQRILLQHIKTSPRVPIDWSSRNSSVITSSMSRSSQKRVRTHRTGKHTWRPYSHLCFEENPSTRVPVLV
ncbi:hypothetical protein EDD16DRAFT_1585477 [Pisolithus croceorrhizus]|nr:hypothetical protein EDD16DRAFT_1585477 [Pisolithus croceorrhizus]